MQEQASLRSLFPTADPPSWAGHFRGPHR